MLAPDLTRSLPRRRMERLCLMVLADGVVATHELPAAGRVTIGRTRDCTISIDSTEVSRRHAAIEIGGERMWVEDLGSANGTRVRDAAVTAGDRVAITTGDSIELGSVIALLQYLPEVPAREVADPIILDPAMVALYRVIDRLVGGTLPILLLGEPGVGKELIAEQLHARSRRSKSLVRVDCAALTEPALDDVLATSGATVFLDEVADLPLAVQARLLRVLDEPPGVRFVSATTADVTLAIEDGRFREDLYHRLAGVTLVVPPLRARPLERRPLAQLFVQRAARRHDLAVPVLAPEVEAWIERHDWPGNVRELRATMERALLLAGDRPIGRAHLSSLDVDADPDRARTLDALARCHGNQTRAARLLGIARSTLLKRLDLYEVPRPRKA